MPNALAAQLCRLSIAVLLCLGSLAPYCAFCQELPDIAQCLKRSQYVPQAAAAQVQIDGASLRIGLYQDPRAQIKDLKINSILLSKELSDAYPDAFESYIFSYFPVAAQNCYTEVAVTKRDLMLFASRQLSKSEILGRVTLEPFLANSLKSRYQALSYYEILNYSDNQNSKDFKQRILSLKANGYDVAVAERQFLKMEDLARNKDEAAYEEAKVALAKCLDQSVLNDAPGKIRLANEGTLWPR